MKKTFLRTLFFVTLGLFVFASCGKKGGTPESVAESFIKEFKAMDFDGMKKYASADYSKDLDEQSSQFETVKSSPEKEELIKELKKQDLTIQPAEINEAGDEAKVKASYTDKEGNEGAWKLELVKEGDQWKVDELSIK